MHYNNIVFAVCFIVPNVFTIQICTRSTDIRIGRASFVRRKMKGLHRFNMAMVEVRDAIAASTYVYITLILFSVSLLCFNHTNHWKPNIRNRVEYTNNSLLDLLD